MSIHNANQTTRDLAYRNYEPGAVYWEADAPSAREDGLVMDPPVTMPDEMMDALRLGPVPRGGEQVRHIVDIVSEEHYPNVADFVESARRLGLSARLPDDLDLGCLTQASRLLLVHGRAWIANYSDYGQPRCPRMLHTAELGEQLRQHLFCAGIWWEDLEGGQPIGDDGARLIERELRGVSYFGMRRPAGVTPVYAPAVFACVAPSRLALVPGKGITRQAVQAAVEGRFDVREVG